MKKKKKNIIGAVICTLNEEETIGDIVKNAKKFVDEVCIVDGHSKDKTVDRAKKTGACVIFEEERGKGGAIRTAARRKNYDIFVFLDADGSHDPDDIPKLIQPIKKDWADHVIGSRLRGGSDELHGSFTELLKLFGASFATLCINIRFKQDLSDSQNGFRAIRGKVLKALNLTENSVAIEQEILVKTIKNGYKTIEVPAHEYERKAGKAKVNAYRQIPRHLHTLIKYILF